MNVVAFSGSHITWNGDPVNPQQLREYLSVAKTFNPAPFTVFDPTGSPGCEEATRLRDEINAAVGCQADNIGGGCGQGSLIDWKHAPGLSGPGWVE